MILEHHNCEAYLSQAKESERQIVDNLEKVINSFGADKAELFLSTATRVLKESVDTLVSSLETKDIDLLARSAHKLRGSSNLYASDKLSVLLRNVVDNPAAFIDDEAQTTVLMCEFKLVLGNINKISDKL